MQIYLELYKFARLFKMQIFITDCTIHDVILHYKLYNLSYKITF